MSAQKSAVEAYVEGFRRLDRDMILDRVHEDVIWVIHGHKELVGKEEFAGEITNDVTPGRPELTVRRLIEEDNLVVAEGTGRVGLAEGGDLEFVFCDVFTFTDGLISRLESYQVNLTEG